MVTDWEPGDEVMTHPLRLRDQVTPGMSPTPASASDCQAKGSTMSAPATAANEKPSRRATLSRRASFWAAAACAFLAFAASTAASPLFRVYEDKFSFAATTLTLLFTVYIVVLLGTLLLFGSLSDYTGRRTVMLTGLVLGAAGCGLFLIAHGVGLLFSESPAGSVGCVTGRVVVGRARRVRASRARSRREESGSRTRVG